MTEDGSIEELQERLRQLQAFMNHSPAAAYMKDEFGRYVYFSDRMKIMFYAPLADLKGKTDFDWLPEYMAAEIWASDQQVLQTGDPLQIIQSIPGLDGNPLYWLVFKFPFTNVLGEKFVGGVAVNITQLKLTEARLSISEQRYRHLVESSQGLICSHDMAGNILSVNSAVCKALGYEADELVGHSLLEILKPGLEDEYTNYLEQIDAKSTHEGVMLLVTKDGRLRTWQYHNAKLEVPGEDPYVLGHAQDITELKELQQRFENLSFTDDLTNLNNRRGFLHLAENRLSHAKRYEESMLLLFADVDGLKNINDTYGHTAGSQLIMDAADILRDSFRQSDVLSRWGGDEFVVLLGKATDDNEEVILGRLNGKIAGFNERSANPFKLSISIGLTPINLSNEISLDQLIAEADVAMYANKRMRRLARETR